MVAQAIVPVELIIPDAGPLISLAHAGQLDLISVFSPPAGIADVVKFECLKKPESPDYEAMKQWFERNSNSIHIIETPFAENYREALRKEASGEKPRATRGLGDATITWILANLDDVSRPGVTPLVLTEDKTFSLILKSGYQAHVLSTRAWLNGLEEAGAIESAAALLQLMTKHGRSVSNLHADHPVTIDSARSDWVENVNPLYTMDKIRELLAEPLVDANSLKSSLDGASAFAKSVAKSAFVAAYKRDGDNNTIALIAQAPPQYRRLAAQAANLGHSFKTQSHEDVYVNVAEHILKTMTVLEVDEPMLASLKRHGATADFITEVELEMVRAKTPSK